MEENKEVLVSESPKLETYTPETPLVEAPKKKRGRPVGWRGTYKKRVKETKEIAN